MTAKTEAEALPPGPYQYRPNEYDDWGFVRDTNGDLVADTCPPWMAGRFAETFTGKKFHDPEWHAGPPQARAVAQLLIDAEANQRKVDELAAENERLRSLLRKIIDDASPCTTAGNLMVETELVRQAEEALQEPTR